MNEEEFLKKLGSNIKTIRKEKKLSLDQLAKHGFEKANLSRLEAGKSNPTILTLFRVSNALEAPIRLFFED